MFSDETIVHTCSLVVEVPADCGDDELQEFGAVALESKLIQQSGYPSWEETNKSYGFEIQDYLIIEEAPDHEEADLTLVRDEDGSLVGD
jgi:hypothetical protein